MQILSKTGTENNIKTSGLNFIPGIVENIENLNALNKNVMLDGTKLLIKIFKNF